MNEKLTILPPSANWSTFKEYQELLDYLWKSLKLKEKNEGNWEYMNFTSYSSTWDLVLDDSVVASVYITMDENDYEKIVDFTLVLKDDTYYEVQEIKALLTKLKNNYQLVITQQLS